MIRSELHRTGIDKRVEDLSTLAAILTSEVAILMVALVLRLGFVLAYGVDAPLPSMPDIDDPRYDALATALASSGTYPDGWFPPGYPLFLALIYSLFGHSFAAVRVVQALLGAATCLITVRLGRKVFEPRIALLAGWILCFYPGHVYTTWRLLAENAFTFFTIAALLQTVSLFAKPTPGRALQSGGLFGAAHLLKSNLVTVPVTILIWFAWRAFRGSTTRLLPVALFCVSFLLLAAVTPVLNLSWSGRRVVPLPVNGGPTLLWANNPFANGYFVSPHTLPEGKEFIDDYGMTERFQAVQDEIEAGKLSRMLAIAWITDNPSRFVSLCGQKLLNGFGLSPTSMVFRDRPLVRYVHLLTYGPVFFLALIGIPLAYRRTRFVGVLYLVLATHTAMVLVFYGTPRFTVVIMPLLLLFTATTISRLYDNLRLGHGRKPEGTAS